MVQAKARDKSKKRGKLNSILAQSTKIFAAKNFDAVSTAQIAVDSHCSEPLLYYHFDGKSAIYVYIVRAAHNRYHDLLNSVPKSASPEERLASIINLHFRFIKDHPDEAILLVRAVSKALDGDAYEELCRLAGQSLSLLENHLQGCIKDGIGNSSFVEDNPKKTAAVLVLMLRYLMESASDKNIEKLKNEFLSFCQRAMARKG